MATAESFESIQQALRAIVQPLDESVRGLGSKFDDHRVQTAERLAGIQADLKHIRTGHADLQSQVKEIRDDQAECVARTNWPLVANLIQRDENTAAFRSAQPTTKKSDPSISIPISKATMRWIPWLIVSALLGAAVVGGVLVGRELNPFPVPTTTTTATSAAKGE